MLHNELGLKSSTFKNTFIIHFNCIINSRKIKIILSTFLRVIPQSSNLFVCVLINLEPCRRVVSRVI